MLFGSFSIPAVRFRQYFFFLAEGLLTDQWQNKTSRQFFLYIFLSLNDR